jgi:calcineurin-like phosphoesterase family protein
MKYLLTYQLFEDVTDQFQDNEYQGGDVVLIHDPDNLTSDLISVKILKAIGKNYFEVSFDVVGSSHAGRPKVTIRRKDILKKLRGNDEFDTDTRINLPHSVHPVSNDLALVGYPKTI